MIDRVAEEIQMIGQTLDSIDGVMTHARNSKFDLLHIGQLLKLDNQKKEEKKKEEANPSWQKENSTT
jgi:uncharacterized protein (UPF0335 family)